MIARLEAYSELKIDNQVLFMDADSLVLNKIKKLVRKVHSLYLEGKRRDVKSIIFTQNGILSLKIKPSMR